MSSELSTHQADFFYGLSKVQIDPFLTSVFDKMKLYEELLKDEFVDSTQINEIMHELDAEWANLMRKMGQVTGFVSFLPPDADGNTGAAVREFYESEEMMFGGVFPVEIDTLYSFDNENHEDLHKYKLCVRFAREAISSDGQRVELYGTAEVDDILSITFPNMMSVEGAREWLNYYHADCVQDIDVALLNPGIEECELAIRLRDIEADVLLSKEDDEDTHLRSMIALNIYTNDLIQFDSDVPYELSVEGAAWSPEGTTLERSYISGTTIVAVDRIVWLTADEGSEHKYYPHLATRFLSESKDEPDTDMLVPLSSVKSFKSFRYNYFVGY